MTERRPRSDGSEHPEGFGPVAHVLLADGTVAVIRPLHAADRDALHALYDEADPEMLRLRFFTASREAAHAYARGLFGGNDEITLTLVAEVHGRLVAEATAARLSPASAEVAFFVADTERGHGVGSLLLEHLADGCARRGVRRFLADVMPENDAMLGVFRAAGFRTMLKVEDGVARFEISTTATPSALSAADDRDSQAEERSLRRLLLPRSVAVVGARQDGTGLGHAVLRSIVDNGFRGEVQVIHPEVDSVGEVPAHHSLADLPRPVDLVIIAVPAASVADVVRAAGATGAGAAVVLSSGFSEVGAEGAARQQELAAIARQHSLRLVGPNCLGVIANDPQVRLHAVFSGSTPHPGGLAIASQSGGFGVTVLDLATELGVGVRSFVSLGNKADVSGNDLLAAWYSDPAVTAAALYLESFGNTPTLARLARRFSERKPLLAVVGGRSSSGQRAGSPHTGATGLSGIGVDALFAQAGVISCRSAESLVSTALVLQRQPLPQGRRIGLISNADGIGILAADSAEELGLVVPALSDGLRLRMAQGAHGVTAAVGNSVDLGSEADGARVSHAVAELAASDEVDAVVVGLVATRFVDPLPTAEELRHIRGRNPEVPLLLVPLGGLEVPPEVAEMVTVLRTPGEAVEALAGAAKYAEWCRITHAARVEEPDLDDRSADRADRARALAKELIGDNTKGAWLGPQETRHLLEPYGLAPLGELCANVDEAMAASRRLPGAIVVKVADREVVHRSDRGLVRVGLRSDEEVQEALRAFETELRRSGVPVQVQPVVQGVEVAMGMVRDPVFGPLLTVSAGGLASDLLDDRAHLLPPVHRSDAARALRSLRVWPLLDGYRGTSAADVDRLEELFVELARLVADVPEIAEIDLNPVIAFADGAALVDVKVRLAAAADDPHVARQLRRG